jgi:hypothetical protein
VPCRKSFPPNLESAPIRDMRLSAVLRIGAIPLPYPSARLRAHLDPRVARIRCKLSRLKKTSCDIASYLPSPPSLKPCINQISLSLPTGRDSIIDPTDNIEAFYSLTLACLITINRELSRWASLTVRCGFASKLDTWIICSSLRRSAASSVPGPGRSSHSNQSSPEPAPDSGGSCRTVTVCPRCSRRAAFADSRT